MTTTEETKTETTKADASKGGPKEKRIKSYSPFDLAIAGGKCLPDDEQGPLDTDVDLDDPLYDPRLLKDLDPAVEANVEVLGVLVPVNVTMRDGVPFVVAGKRRVRMARRISRRRAAKNEPAIMIDTSLVASKTGLRLTAALIAENAGRLNDGFVETVANMRRFMERYPGTSIEDAAVTFAIDVEKAKRWMDFDDNAIEVVRDFVHRDVLSVSAGIEIVRAGNPDAQRVALADLLQDAGLVDLPETPAPSSGPMPAEPSAKAKIEQAKAKIDARAKAGKATKISARAARSASKRVSAPSKNEGVRDVRTLTKLLQAMRDLSHKGKADRTLAFWDGAEHMLTLVLGGDEANETDDRLVELLKAVRTAMRKAGGK